MTDQTTFSDEMLNAYIDGELDDTETRRLLEQLQHDDTLSERLAHLREVSDMLKMSYAGVKPPGKCEFKVTQWTKTQSLAAGLLLFIGVAIGWSLNQPAPAQNLLADYAQKQPADGVWRIVIHANTADDYMQYAMLEETEAILKAFKENGNKVEVEIEGIGVLMNTVKKR